MADKEYGGVRESTLKRHYEALKKDHPQIMEDAPEWADIPDDKRENIAASYMHYQREMNDFGKAISEGRIETGLTVTKT